MPSLFADQHLVRTWSAWAAAVDVLDANVVAATEAQAILTPIWSRNEMRIAEFIAVVHVGRAMVFEVFAGAINAVTEASLTHLRELRRRRIPTALRVASRRWWRRALKALRLSDARCENKRKKSWYDTPVVHRFLSEENSSCA